MTKVILTARLRAAELLLGLAPPPGGWTARAFIYERDHHLLTGLDHDRDLARGYGDMAAVRHPDRVEEIQAAVSTLVAPPAPIPLPSECGMGRDAGHDGPHRSTGTTFAAYWERQEDQ